MLRLKAEGMSRVHADMSDKFTEFCNAKGMRVVGNRVALHDVNKVLKLTNIRRCVRGLPVEVSKCSTPGGPQNMSFVDASTVRRIVSKMRYPVDPEMYEALDMKFEKQTIFCPSEESKCVEFIESAFEGERMIRQHVVGRFRVDLFFPNYNLAVEIDEAHHRCNAEEDAARQRELEDLMACVFVRCDTTEDGSLAKCCNAIFKHIKGFRS